MRTIIRSTTSRPSHKISFLMRTTAITAVGLLAITNSARAADITLPVNGQVVGGSADFSNPSVGSLGINQNTDRVVINWDSFNIGKDATVQFYQPGTGSVAVNRVVGLGNDPTKILGTLKANGNVMVLDRNGVLFGKDAVVDVGGIIASTGDVDTAAIMNGDTKFNITGITGNKAVQNDGKITVADGGFAAFVAPVVRNNGTITAHAGRVALASGNEVTVDFYGDSLVELVVPSDSADARILNQGLIDAAGGTVTAQIDVPHASEIVKSVVNNHGIVNATTAQVIGNKIVLSAGGSTVINDGKLTAGKSVNVTGTTVKFNAGSTVTADTEDGSGEVIAIASGKGTYNGYISAAGGHIETSAANSITIGHTAEIHASTWLIDPLSIDIRETDAGGAVNANVIEAALNDGTDVTIETNATGPDAGNIDLFAHIDWTTAASLVLNANNDIHFSNNSGLSSTDAANITLSAGDDIRLSKSSGTGISTNGGNISLTSGDITQIRDGNTIDAQGGNVVIDNGGALLADANTIRTTGTGTITVNQNKTSEVVSALLKPLYSIQGALNAISNSGSGLNTINVGSGTWTENITIDKSNILLNGNRAGFAGTAHSTSGVAGSTVKSTNAYTRLLTIHDADNVTVDGFDFDGSYGIGAYDASNVTFQNNIVKNSNGDGISASGVSGLLIADNFIDASAYDGIYVEDANGYSPARLFALVEEEAPSANVTIKNNTIRHSGDNGIELYGDNGSVLIDNNKISYSGINGILVAKSSSGYYGYYGFDKATVDEGDSYDLTITNNNIVNSKNDGIKLANLDGTAFIDTNYIHNSDLNGIEVLSGSDGYYGGYYGYYGYPVINTMDNLVISNNTVDESDNNGIYVHAYVNDATIDTNHLSNNFNGIAVNSDINAGSGYYGYYGYDDAAYNTLNIINNDITKSDHNGILLQNISGDILVDNNTITASGWNGIAADYVNTNSFIFALFDDEEEGDTPVNQLVITNNTIDNTIHYNGVNLYNVGGYVKVADNTITNSRTDGIFAFSDDFTSFFSPIDLHIVHNTITNPLLTSGRHRFAGIELELGGNGYAEISNNDIGTNFQYGLVAYSGTIDLTGTTNTIHDTDIGMGFYPRFIGLSSEGDGEGDGEGEEFSDLVADPDYAAMAAELHLVNDTIGTTKFVNQIAGFVDLGQGAFFAPGFPTILNGNDATYTLGGVTIDPASDGTVTAAELAVLESMFYHYNDVQDRGLFFFQAAAGTNPLDQKDIFRNFDPNAPQTGSGNLIITGLPRIGGNGGGNGGGGPANFNDITPAAGDEEGDSGEQAQNIEPAAGGDADNTACWADASASLGQGKPVNFNLGGGNSQLMQDAVDCGSQAPTI